MRKKIHKVLSLMLCVILLCSMMPTAVSAAITEYDEYDYGITTFEDLKELVGATYPEDVWVSISCDTEQPIVIQEDLTIHENISVNFSETPVVVPEGVTLTLNEYSHIFSELIIDGTMVNNGWFVVDNELTVNGNLINYGSFTIEKDCAVSGRDNVSCLEEGFVIWDLEYTDFNSLKEYLDLANTYSNDMFYIFAADEKESGDIHVTADLTISENVSFEADINTKLTVEAGYTLKNNGGLQLDGASLIVNGVLDNEGYMSLSYAWGEECEDIYSSMVIGEGGKYTGIGNITVRGDQYQGLQEYLKGLDLRQFIVETIYLGDDEYFIWKLLHKDYIASFVDFEDVSPEDYYFLPVAWAADMGITKGYGSEDTFCPGVDCTRGQVVTFLWRAVGSPEPTSLENPFTDVASDAYYYKAVLWAVENGITAGYGSDTIFNPEGICNRAQVATFLWRTAGEPERTDEENVFTDIAESAYYYDAVLWAVASGITNGYGSDTTFNPDGNCTRGQIVTFLYRANN